MLKCMQTSETPARALRARFSGAERDASRLRLLQGACTALADETEVASGLRAALAQLLRFLTADGAAVLRHEPGALTVLASQGVVLPVGARVPAVGALKAGLESSLLLREQVVSTLKVGAPPLVALELLLPLRSRGKVRGLLAVVSSRSIALPDSEDLATLQALAALMGSALTEATTAAKPRGGNREAQAALARLSPREQQVFALLPRGLTNAQLADELGIALGTVKIHMERILHKLGVSDRTQAAVRASEWGYRA